MATATPRHRLEFLDGIRAIAALCVVVSHAFTLNLLVRRVLGLADSPSVFFRTDNCALHRLKRAPTGFWQGLRGCAPRAAFAPRAGRAC